MLFLGKKILSLCLGVMVCMFFFNSCKSTEQKNLEISKQTFQSIKFSINENNGESLKSLFSTQGSSDLSEEDIKSVLSVFSSGITECETPYDDSLLVIDGIENDNYVKSIEWSREIIDNATGNKYVLTVLECTNNWSNANNVGIVRFTLYAIENENDFLNWWSSLEETEYPNGIIFYKN